MPDTLLFIPMFQIVKSIGLLNSYWGMVLVYPTLTVPFCTWIMIGYFQSIPKELDEAALIDGAGHMQMLFKIFIPVALPGIIAATIFAFTVSWAAFVYPMAFLYSSDQQVLTVGTVTSLIRGDVYKWGMLMAGALIAAAPPLVIYAFLMDYYIAGLDRRRHQGLTIMAEVVAASRSSRNSARSKRCAPSIWISRTTNSSFWSALPAAARAPRCA